MLIYARHSQFHPDDDSAHAVLAYAVGTVGVEHGASLIFIAHTPDLTSSECTVILAGHTHCGGAAACLKAHNEGTPITATATPLSRWLAPLSHLIAALDFSATPADKALDRIVAENVRCQVANICEAEPVKKAWADGKSLSVHGWVYDLASGRIKDLEVTRGPGSEGA